MSPGLSIALAALIGALSGTHAAIWGMYKDAVHEGFSPLRFTRSIIVGAIVGALIQGGFHLALPQPGAIALMFGLAYAGERGIVEVWKTFWRVEDQSKYFIPMQFAVRGVPVRSRGARLAAGAAYVGVVGLALWGISRLDASPTANSRLVAALVGLAVGMVIAISGAWKDAPKEGFDPIKFFRSPSITVFYAVLLSLLTPSYLLIAAASIGYERGTAETYKTFFFPSKPRGKFSGKPITHPQMLRNRLWFVPAYAAICVGAIACIVAAL